MPQPADFTKEMAYVTHATAGPLPTCFSTLAAALTSLRFEPADALPYHVRQCVNRAFEAAKQCVVEYGKSAEQREEEQEGA